MDSNSYNELVEAAARHLRSLGWICSPPLEFDFTSSYCIPDSPSSSPIIDTLPEPSTLTSSVSAPPAPISTEDDVCVLCCSAVCDVNWIHEQYANHCKWCVKWAISQTHIYGSTSHVICSKKWQDLERVGLARLIKVRNPRGIIQWQRQRRLKRKESWKFVKKGHIIHTH